DGLLRLQGAAARLTAHPTSLRRRAHQGLTPSRRTAGEYRRWTGEAWYMLLTLRRGHSPPRSQFSIPATARMPRRGCPRVGMFLLSRCIWRRREAHHDRLASVYLGQKARTVAPLGDETRRLAADSSPDPPTSAPTCSILCSVFGCSLSG